MIPQINPLRPDSSLELVLVKIRACYIGKSLKQGESFIYLSYERTLEVNTLEMVTV